MRRRYLLLDVFTRTRFAGNPLAVFPEAEGLDTAAMQRIAGELNLSETTFVLPPEKPGDPVRVRIFTPARELPFAGHPTVGTAAALLPADVPAGDMVLTEQVGDVPVSVRRDGAAVFAEFTVPSLPTRESAAVPAATAARVLGLAEEAVVDTAVWSAGVPFLIVRLADRATVDAAVLDTAVWTAELAGGEGAHVYVAAADGTDAHGRPIWHVRMFAPAMGIAEDPATGAAACAFAGALAADLPDGDHRVVIRQGVAMGRPSVLELGIDVAGGVPRKVTLGGHAVPMGEGQLETSPTDAPAT